MKPYTTAENITEKAKVWMEIVKPFNRHQMQLTTDKSALLVIDMQKFFLDPSSPTYTCGSQAIVPNIKRLITAFREKNRPIIYTKHVHDPNLSDAGIMEWWWAGMILEGSPESEVCADISPLAGEKVILKHRYSAFYNTDLETVLRVLKIEDLVITGVMTNLCCESTARDAYYRDYRVFFMADATGAMCEEMHTASLLNLAYGFAQITVADQIIMQLTGG